MGNCCAATKSKSPVKARTITQQENTPTGIKSSSRTAGGGANDMGKSPVTQKRQGPSGSTAAGGQDSNQRTNIESNKDG